MVDPSVGATMDGEPDGVCVRDHAGGAAFRSPKTFVRKQGCGRTRLDHAGSAGRRARTQNLENNPMQSRMSPGSRYSRRLRPGHAAPANLCNFTLLIVLTATWACHTLFVKGRESVNASEVSARRERRDRHRIQPHRRVHRAGHYRRRPNDRPKAH